MSGRIPLDSFEALQFTAAISQGSSGGALFNEKGEVVGITFASYVDGQNMNLAIPIDIITPDNFKSPSYRNIEISAIYQERHPYMKYYTTYDMYVEKVTLDQLKQNPEHYVGEKIILEAYLSSVKFHPQSLCTAYISNSQDTSSNYDNDYYLYKNLSYRNNPTILVTGVLSQFTDAAISSEDHNIGVVIVGDFLKYNDQYYISLYNEKQPLFNGEIHIK